MLREQRNMISPVRLFYSYAHEDEPFRIQLEKYLSPLYREGLITEWHDRHIVPGTDWTQEIVDKINKADIILLLISPDFLASDYCWEIEMERAMERYRRGKTRVIPVILRPCYWKIDPIKSLQALPRDARPVGNCNNDKAFYAIMIEISQIITSIQNPSRQFAFSIREDEERQRLLERVRHFWITGKLEQAFFYPADLIKVGLIEQPDAVENPLSSIDQETNLPPHDLEKDTPIMQVYDDAKGELLILGELGAGKTTLQLELTRELLNRAERDRSHFVPVIFNLSSYKQQGVGRWLVEELQEKYYIEGNIAEEWIVNDQILLLLDGLDEVASDVRETCLKDINTYRKNHRVPVVICSRKTEYMLLTKQLVLQCAVTIQPLNMQQINEYLLRVGGQLEAIRTALQADSVLREVVSTPLMLNIVIAAYQGSSVEDLVDIRTRKAKRKLFHTYVERMFTRRGASKRYKKEKTKHWLQWLAKQMIEHHQAEFSLKNLQSDWLPFGFLRLYNYIAVICFFLIFFIVPSLIVGIPALIIIPTSFQWIRLFSYLVSIVIGIVVFKCFISLKIVEFTTFLLYFGILVAFLILASNFQWFHVNLWIPNVILDFFLLGSGLQYLIRGKIVQFVIFLLVAISVVLLIVASSFKLINELHIRQVIGGILLTLILVSEFSQMRITLEEKYPFPRLLPWLVRLFLCLAGCTPWNYSRFLDYAVERILLHRVDRNYEFIHRLLLEYFACLDTEQTD